jgi:hypothetical protein
VLRARGAAFLALGETLALATPDDSAARLCDAGDHTFNSRAAEKAEATRTERAARMDISRSVVAPVLTGSTLENAH